MSRDVFTINIDYDAADQLVRQVLLKDFDYLCETGEEREAFLTVLSMYYTPEELSVLLNKGNRNV